MLDRPSRIGALGALILSFAIAYGTGRPPSAGPLDAPAEEFSASRARRVQERLFAGNLPHPIGSLEHAAVRERVVDELRGLGLVPEVQEVVACSPEPICATVRNVVARIAGARSTGSAGAASGAVLLATHYDSVAAGPGASDAGASVAAVIEIARALQHPPGGVALERDVILLIDDGEEADLLGAEGFLRHRWFGEVGAVVNLEARGTEGQSFWFETAPGNARVVDAVAPRLSRPATSSTFIEIYRRMPNDTDFSVFRRIGLQGVNLAFIGGGTRYHTPLDDLSHSSIASLEHQGRNGLAAVRALARRPGADGIAGVDDAVFFDVASLFVVRWPAMLSWLLGALAGLGALWATRRFAEPPTPVAMAWGVAFGLAAPLLAGGGAELMRRLVVAIGAAPRPWIAASQPLLISIWVMALAGFALAAILFARRAGTAGTWLGTWMVWSLVGLLLSWKVPGASYLFLVPALVAAAVAGLTRRPVVAMPALAAGVLWWGLALRLYGALGVPLLAATGAVVGLVVATTAAAWTAPGRAGKSVFIAVCAAVALASAIFLKVLPHATPSVPERLNLLAFAEGSGPAALYAFPESGGLPRELAAAARWAPIAERAFPWSARPGGGLRADLSDSASPPLLDLLESAPAEGGRRVRLRLRSTRQAPILSLWFPPGVDYRALSVDGVVPPSADDSAAAAKGATRKPIDSWRAVSILAGPVDGSIVEFQLQGAAPVELLLTDRSRTLPPSAVAVASQRPARAVPSGQGDGWLVLSRTTI